MPKGWLGPFHETHEVHSSLVSIVRLHQTLADHVRALRLICRDPLKRSPSLSKQEQLLPYAKCLFDDLVSLYIFYSSFATSANSIYPKNVTISEHSRVPDCVAVRQNATYCFMQALVFLPDCNQDFQVSRLKGFLRQLERAIVSFATYFSMPFLTLHNSKSIPASPTTMNIDQENWLKLWSMNHAFVPWDTGRILKRSFSIMPLKIDAIVALFLRYGSYPSKLLNNWCWPFDHSHSWCWAIKSHVSLLTFPVSLLLLLFFCLYYYLFSSSTSRKRGHRYYSEVGGACCNFDWELVQTFKAKTARSSQLPSCWPPSFYQHRPCPLQAFQSFLSHLWWSFEGTEQLQSQDLKGSRGRGSYELQRSYDTRCYFCCKSSFSWWRRCHSRCIWPQGNCHSWS